MKTISKVLALAGLLAVFATSAFAQPALYVAGTHYEELPSPVRTSDPNKIEVTEVFWYGCPHCYAFEPLIENWKQNLPSDVNFVLSPGMWNQLMQVHAQTYYAAESLGVLDTTHDAVFSAFHQDQNYLQSKEEVQKLFAEVAGVSEEDFDKAWNSFSVTSSVSRANTRMRDYGVRGVPSIIVNGKYRISAGGAVATQADMLKVAEFLIEKERAS